MIEIIKRWVEFIKTLYNDEQCANRITQYNYSMPSTILWKAPGSKNQLKDN